MNPVVEDVWHIANRHGWDPGAQLVDSRAAWDAHEYLATYSACVMAFQSVLQMANAPEGGRADITAPTPPAEVLAVVGDRSRGDNTAHATWDVVKALALKTFEDDDDGGPDRFLMSRLQNVSREFKGSGVYLFAWWTYGAIDVIRHKRPETFEAELAKIESMLDTIGQGD